MTRKVIIAILGIALVFGAVRIAQVLSNQKELPRPRPEERVTSVVTQVVENRSVPISISTSGSLRAKSRIELYAQVSDVFVESAHSFKPGTYYNKGEVLVRLDDREEKISLQAQRSSLQNQLVGLLPDLRFDYPESVEHWQAYLAAFDVDGVLADFPDPVNEKERLFLVGRNIYTTFYNIKNSEDQLRNFVIRAPYPGVLTEALVEPGTLVRTGQKIGAFINTYTFELEVAVNTEYADFMAIGKPVALHNSSRTAVWTGKVIRMNAIVEPGSQTIPVFVQVSGKGLREGMYLEADIVAREEQGTFEVDRKLLVGEDQVYVVRDSVLALETIEPVYFSDRTVVIRGLEDGTHMLSNPVPGAHAGLRVKMIDPDN